MANDSQNTNTAYTTIEEYLRGCVGFNVADEAIRTILIDREVVGGSDVVSIDKRTKDLCKADLYMWCASTPSVTNSVEDSNGVWKHKEGGIQSSAFDKRNLRQMANEIYRLYGEKVVSSKVKIISFGMSMTRNEQ